MKQQRTPLHPAFGAKEGAFVSDTEVSSHGAVSTRFRLKSGCASPTGFSSPRRSVKGIEDGECASNPATTCRRGVYKRGSLCRSLEIFLTFGKKDKGHGTNMKTSPPTRHKSSTRGRLSFWKCQRGIDGVSANSYPSYSRDFMLSHIGKRSGGRSTRTRYQLASLALSNLYLAGALKFLPYPFLHCYACPLAVAACPIGTLQHFIIIGEIPLFLIGFIGAVGLLASRLPCGWLCPFGFIQDILRRAGDALGLREIRLPRGRIPIISRVLIVVVLVLLLPYFTHNPWFCRLCPAGTLEGGIWIPFLRPGVRSLIGPSYWFKIGLLILTVALALSSKRPFCRFVCPMGFFLGLSGSTAALVADKPQGRVFSKDKCNTCLICEKECPMGSDPRAAAERITETFAESLDCIECDECRRCPTGAIS
jgi:ferredoxin-type protein NapH